MAGCLLHTQEQSVTISATAARRLLERGDGDAALLYLALLRHSGQMTPRSLAKELRWEKERIEQSEKILQEIELISAEKTNEVPLEPAQERPTYQSHEVAQRLEETGEFASLVHAVEQILGKRLTTADVGVLLGLYDFLGLPVDVIYLLVSHCTQRVTQRYGIGRRPGMKQIEKEGYAWAKLGIDTQHAAAEHLSKYASRQETQPQYMNVLGLGERTPSPSEEKYLHAWQNMGFAPEAVALAYDKTIMRCHELKWAYLNAILKKWDEAGLHTLEEVSGSANAPAKTAPVAPSSDIRKYVQQLHRSKEEDAHGI